MHRDGYGPLLGAEHFEGGTRFALWTSTARRCAVRLMEPGKAERTVPLLAGREGLFEATVPGIGHGARYSFVLDGVEVRDPYAAYLPDGVDGPAMVWKSRYAFRHPLVSRPLAQHVLYELHIGTFTKEGTYAAACRRLPYLHELGVTAVELMPLGAFPGTRGWGYDVVAHYAPFAPYGDPDELRSLVDHAHGLGIAVLLDVVYNHFGPAGNVLPSYAPEYFDRAYESAWGDAPNFSHPAMRRYVVRNVRYWLDEFRFDGLRVDATHTIVDESPKHILRELAEEVAQFSPKRLLIAEDDRNAPHLVTADGFDAVWADDFHHQIRVALTGERDGYYAAYTGAATDLANTIEGGFFYRGATYPPTGRPRGEAAPGLPAEAFVYCIQNHDQVGNRAMGDRLPKHVSSEAFGAASMLLLFLPMTPLLFMGQEWGASTPFLYFTDHAVELGRHITEGRRKEFSHFAAFADDRERSRIPDPQEVTTFERSRLDWNELTREPHSDVLRLYRALLRLRTSDSVLRSGRREELRAFARGDVLVVERWSGTDARGLVMNLGTEAAEIPLPPGSRRPELLLASHRGTDLGKGIEPWSAALFAYERTST